ncbi:adenosylmethionine decarboxylase [PVC group bacterium]|nr:adenosylmethionine decarboxylase [PVC group bacterium]
MKPLGTQHIAEFINCSTRFLRDRQALIKALREGIKASGLTLLSIRTHAFKPAGMTVIAIIGESHIAIHTYPEARHASLDIYTCSPNSEPHFILLQYLRKKLKPRTVRILELLRGNPIEIKQQDWLVSFTTYGFEISYHIVKSYVSKKTAFRQIDLIENDSFGRMLFMDRDIRISDKDADNYAANILQPIRNVRNRIRRVAVFGCEDGGVAVRELLNSGVEEIYLVEFDNELLQVVEKHMKIIHENAFKNPRVNVVVTDIENFMKNHRGFDAVIHNYSMHPEGVTRKDRTEFLRDRFLKISRMLNPRGILSLECCSEYDLETQKLVKRLLAREYKDVVFRSSFLPSYCESWIFASARVKNAR